LVLGVAFGLPPSTIEPFVHSLRATAYRGRLGLIVAQCTESDLRAFQSLADFTVVIDHDYPRPGPQWLLAAMAWLRRTPGLRRLYPWAFFVWATAGRERESQARWERLEFTFEGLQSLRYKHYHDVIERIAPDAEEILLTDVRDVLFQADPFDREVAELEVVLEDPSMTLDDQPNNRRWLAGLYGPDALVALRGLTASCSGTVAGRRAGILRYLAEMRTAIGWRRRPLGSHDQGIHNYLLRNGQLGEPLIVENGSGRVLTMGGMARVRERSDGTVLNDDGSVPAVLHQYDRDPDRAARLLTRLGGRG
jgi:hypothetical protein